MTDVEQVAQPFDYTSRDFGSLITDVTRRMRTAIPGWEPSPSAFEMVLLEQFAYVGDILNFYIDRMAAESYIQTAVLRESVLNLAYAFGYVPTAQTAARANVTFTKTTGLGDVLVPKGTQVFANADGQQIIFETVADLNITGASGIAVALEGVTVKEELLGASIGAERMQFPLFNRNVIKDSVNISIADGPYDPSRSGPAFVPWVQISRIIDADAVDRVFTVFVDDQGTSIIRLGDGVSGRIPTVGASVYATYRYGVGAAGNVAASTIRSLVSGGDLASQIETITNVAAAVEGADAESLESMRRNIPRSLRSLDRAVTLQDYADLALQVSGIAKASASALLSTNVIVCVTPFSGGAPSTQLSNEVLKYLDTRRMVGTNITIIGPTDRQMNVTGTIFVNPLFVQATVKTMVEDVIRAYYKFDTVELGGTSRLADLYRIISAVPGIASVNLSQHYRAIDTAALVANVTFAYNELPVAGVISITANGGIVP